MPKTEFACSKCGFRAFVESLNMLEMSGWSVERHDDGSRALCCPACRADHVCESEPAQTFAVRGKR